MPGATRYLPLFYKKETVLIAGGGLAGIAAATALAEEGYQITLVERRQFLGGRASAFPMENGWLDNCQHVVLGCCFNLLHLLQKLGTRDLVSFYPKIPFFSHGKITYLSPSKLPVPFHFLPSFLRTWLFSAKEKFNILKLFSKLMKIDCTDPLLEQTTLLDWLKNSHQSDRIINYFWNLIFVSSLNETLDRIAAKYGIMVLQETFLRNREAGFLGTPNVSLAELYDQAAKNLFLKREVKIIHSNVKAILPGETHPKIVLDDNTSLEAEKVISAVPFYNLLPLLPAPIRKNYFFSRFENLETSPIFGIHLWFDRPLSPLPFGGFPGSPIHWFFAKHGEKDAHYLQLVVSACRPMVNWSSHDLINLGMDELKKNLPSSRNARLLKGKVVREMRATFSPKPNSDQYRPPQETPVPGFYLAGDWTATGWPSTMEGAVISGYRAAESILRHDKRLKGLEMQKAAPQHSGKGSP